MRHHLPPAPLAVDEHDVQMRCNCDYYFDDDGKDSSYEKKSKLFYPMSEKWLRVSAIVPADEWEYYENTEPLDELDWSVEEC